MSNELFRETERESHGEQRWLPVAFWFLNSRIRVCCRFYLVNMNLCRLLGCWQVGFTGKHCEWNSGLWNSVPVEFSSHASSGAGPPEQSTGHALGPQLLTGHYSKVLMETDSLPRLKRWPKRTKCLRKCNSPVRKSWFPHHGLERSNWINKVEKASPSLKSNGPCQYFPIILSQLAIISNMVLNIFYLIMFMKLEMAFHLLFNTRTNTKRICHSTYDFLPYLASVMKWDEPDQLFTTLCEATVFSSKDIPFLYLPLFRTLLPASETAA